MIERKIQSEEIIRERMRNAKRYYIQVYGFWVKVNFSDAMEIVKYLHFQVSLDHGSGQSKYDLYIHNQKREADND